MLKPCSWRAIYVLILSLATIRGSVAFAGDRGGVSVGYMPIGRDCLDRTRTVMNSMDIFAEEDIQPLPTGTGLVASVDGQTLVAECRTETGLLIAAMASEDGELASINVNSFLARYIGREAIDKAKTEPTKPAKSNKPGPAVIVGTQDLPLSQDSVEECRSQADSVLKSMYAQTQKTVSGNAMARIAGSGEMFGRGFVTYCEPRKKGLLFFAVATDSAEESASHAQVFRDRWTGKAPLNSPTLIVQDQVELPTPAGYASAVICEAAQVLETNGASQVLSTFGEVFIHSGTKQARATLEHDNKSFTMRLASNNSSDGELVMELLDSSRRVIDRVNAEVLRRTPRAIQFDEQFFQMSADRKAEGSESYRIRCRYPKTSDFRRMGLIR